MFTEVATSYRAGILLHFKDYKCAFSRQFFMREFVAYMAKKAREVDRIDPAVTTELTPKDINAYFRISQSILTSDDRAQAAHSHTEPTCFYVNINNRRLRFPNYENAYVYDDELVASEPDHFTKNISYLAMAKYINDYMQSNKIADADLANDAIDILLGEPTRETAPVIPVMLAALLISESRRNPACFLPTIMLIELIRYHEENPLGTYYQWDNCLQSPVLVNQENDSISFHEAFLYPTLTGMPTLFQIQKNKKTKLKESQKEFMNAEKKYNKAKDQDEVLPHEIHMQHGGYFPQTHRYSYAELKQKRAEGKETMSDIKSFMIISDWLKLNKVAEDIHIHYLHNPVRSPDLDMQADILADRVFPVMWRAFTCPTARARMHIDLASVQAKEEASTAFRP